MSVPRSTIPSDIGRIKLFSGNFRLSLRPDGSVIVPDLVQPMVPLLRSLGAPEELWMDKECAIAKPMHLTIKRRTVAIHRSALGLATDDELWAMHALSLAAESSVDDECEPDLATVLDLKIELARRLMTPCRICERVCGVDRLKGEAGFCGLGKGLQVGANAMLYNEGPLVGAPTFSVFLRGCSLRCSFCYRPDELRARHQPETSPQALAELLDEAHQAGAKSWHFLGGNPDESIYPILQSLAETKTGLPVVWNSALMLTSSALSLLDGIVDVWLPDFKFGNDHCASLIAGVTNYVSTIQRNLAELKGCPYVVVRHMRLAGHERCCTETVERIVLESFPSFHLHLLTHFPAAPAKGL